MEKVYAVSKNNIWNWLVQIMSSLLWTSDLIEESRENH